MSHFERNLLILFLFFDLIKGKNLAPHSNELALENLTSAVVAALLPDSPFSGHVFVISDDSTLPSVKTGMVNGCWQVLEGATVLTYREGILSTFLSSRYHAKKYHNIFVAASLPAVVKIFQEVKAKRLESGNVLWFVLTNSSLDEELSDKINEGTQVIIIEGFFQGGTKFIIKGSHWNLNSTLSFIGRGFLSYSSGITKVTKLRKPLFPSNELVYRNFRGRRITAASNNYILFFLQRKDKEGNFLPWEGIDVNILNLLAKKHNFSYDLVHPSDGRWGGPEPDGNISGLIGIVARHEAHLSIHELTITAFALNWEESPEKRETVVDFTVPYFLEGSTVASKAPELKDQALLALSPFPLQVWVLILALLGLMCIVAAVFHKLATTLSEGERNLNESVLKFYLFSMFRSLVMQAKEIKTPHSSLRIVLCFWFFFCLIFNALYSGNLVAIFSSPAYYDPINSLEDLLQVMKKGKIYPICSAGTSIDYLFKESTEGIHYNIYQFFVPVKSYVGHEERYKQTADGKAVVLTSWTSNIIQTSIKGREKFYVGKDYFFQQLYGIALPSGSPWKDTLSNTLMRITESGLLDVWVAENVAKELKHNGIRDGNKGNIISKSTSNNPLKLIQLQAAFLILILGYFISSFAIAVEIMVTKVTQKRK